MSTEVHEDVTGEMLRIKDVQEILDVGRRTAYELAHRDDFPAIRVGERSIRIPRHAFREWITGKMEEGIEGVHEQSSPSERSSLKTKDP